MRQRELERLYNQAWEEYDKIVDAIYQRYGYQMVEGARVDFKKMAKELNMAQARLMAKLSEIMRRVGRI